MQGNFHYISMLLQILPGERNTFGRQHNIYFLGYRKNLSREYKSFPGEQKKYCERTQKHWNMFFFLLSSDFFFFITMSGGLY